MSATTLFQRIATEDIFSLLGLQGLSDDKKEEVLDQMYKTVVARVYTSLRDSLSEADRARFDSQEAEAMPAFLQEVGIDIDAMVAEEAVRYRVELATMVDMLIAPAATQPSAA
jgi:hypothetical protein